MLAFSGGLRSALRRPGYLLSSLRDDHRRAGQWVSAPIGFENDRGCDYLQVGIMTTFAAHYCWPLRLFAYHVNPKQVTNCRALKKQKVCTTWRNVSWRKVSVIPYATASTTTAGTTA